MASTKPVQMLVVTPRPVRLARDIGQASSVCGGNLPELFADGS